MGIPATPNNFYVTQANRQVLTQWDIEAGAATYSVQRSTDGITYSTVATPAVNYYLDSTVSSGTQYYYQVAAVNGSGTSAYTAPQAIIPSPTGEMSLAAIRLAAQQRADMQNSNFIQLPEWNSYINQAMFELYDMLVTSFEEYFMAAPASFVANGSQFLYPLPDGVTTFQDQNGSNFIARPFYKLLGVDLAVNTANNAYVTVNKFNFIDRNYYLYPNSASTIYGVFNCRYRVLGSNIEFIPTPSGNQIFRLWYVPRLRELLQDTDITDQGISGWLEYVIVRAALYACLKQESTNVDGLEKQLLFLKQRIEEAAQNRDAGQPDTISNVRQNGFWNSSGGGFGWSGPIGGM